MSKTSLPREEVVDSILEKYADTVYRLALARTKNTFDAEDILQEVFIKYIKSDKQFQSEEHRKAWFLRVTINCSKNLLTSAWFRRTTVFEDNIITTMREKSEVYKYVLDLPKKYRVVIHLFYYEDLSTKDISKILNRKESTVRSQLQRGRGILREKMKGDGSLEF